jgi:hypothetical protein
MTPFLRQSDNDFRIDRTGAATADACAARCTPASGCEFFTFAASKFFCDRFTQTPPELSTNRNLDFDAYERRSDCTTDPNPTTTTTTPSTVAPGCTGVEGYYKTPFSRQTDNNLRIDRTTANAAADCAARCSADGACKYFTYRANTKVCDRFSASPQLTQNNAFDAYAKLPNCGGDTVLTDCSPGDRRLAVCEAITGPLGGANPCQLKRNPDREDYLKCVNDPNFVDASAAPSFAGDGPSTSAANLTAVFAIAACVFAVVAVVAVMVARNRKGGARQPVDVQPRTVVANPLYFEIDAADADHMEISVEDESP